MKWPPYWLERLSSYLDDYPSGLCDLCSFLGRLRVCVFSCYTGQHYISSCCTDQHRASAVRLGRSDFPVGKKLWKNSRPWLTKSRVDNSDSSLYGGPISWQGKGQLVQWLTVFLGDLRFAVNTWHFCLLQEAFSIKHLKCHIQQTSEDFENDNLLSIPAFKQNSLDFSYLI